MDDLAQPIAAAAFPLPNLVGLRWGSTSTTHSGAALCLPKALQKAVPGTSWLIQEIQMPSPSLTGLQANCLTSAWSRDLCLSWLSCEPEEADSVPVPLTLLLSSLTAKIHRACKDKAKSAVSRHLGTCSSTNGRQKRKAAYNPCTPMQEPTCSRSLGPPLHGLKKLVKSSATNYLT